MRASKVFSFFLVWTLILSVLFLNVSLIEARVVIQTPDPSTTVNIFQGNLTNLSQMADTNIPSPSNDEVLTWSSATSKWIAQSVATISKWIVDPSSNYLYNDSTTFYFNETRLNNTIDERASSLGANSSWNETHADTLYVPYTGANQNVDLGANNFSVDSDVLYVDSSNNRVGIGTSSPTTTLDVNGNIVTGGNIRIPYGNFYQVDNSVGSAINLFTIRGTNYIDYYNSFSQIAMTLASSGNIGINTTTPQNKLNVVGSVNISGSGNSLIFPDGTSMTTASTGGSTSWNRSGTDVFLANTGDNVGIGTTTPQRELHVNGDILSNSTINATGDICIEGGNCLSDLKGNLTNFSILQGINNVSIDNLDFNILNFNALNSFFKGNITVNSINITSPSSMFLAGVQWSEETIPLAGFNFSTILVSKLKYFTIGDDLAGQELGFQTQNFNSHPNSSSYIATVNSNGFGNGIFKFSSAYNPYPDWSVYFNNKGLTNFYGHYNDSETMNTSNSGVYFGLASDFDTGANESVVGYQDELFNAYYTKDNFTFFTNTTIEKNLNVKGNISLGQKINFVLGEFIDNIVDGWIRINGNLNVTENTTIEGDLLVKGNTTINLRYGEMWNYSAGGVGWTFPITSADIYYNLTNLRAGELNGFNFTNETQANGGSYLTALTDSLYLMNAHVSYEGALAGGLYGIGITHNFNVDNHRDCYVRDESRVEVHGISITCLVDVTKGDKINLQVENEDAGRDMIIHSANLNFVKIGN